MVIKVKKIPIKAHNSVKKVKQYYIRLHHIYKIISLKLKGCYAVKYKVLLWTSKWAKYINKDIESQVSFTKKSLVCLPNRLTPLYSKIYYKEKNYLKVKTELLIYPSPPIVKVWGIWEC